MAFYNETKFLERDFEVDHERTLVVLRNVRRNTSAISWITSKLHSRNSLHCKTPPATNPKDSLRESKRKIDSAVYAAATVCWLSWTACNDAPNSSTEGSVRNELSIVAGDERLTNEMSEPLWSKSA